MTPRLRKLPALLVLLLAVPFARAELRQEIEPNDTPATAQPVLPTLSVGGIVSAPGDRDLFAFRMPVGGLVQAVILARGFRGGSPLTGLLKILGSDGSTVLAQDQSQGGSDDPAVALQVGAAGVYYVSVEDAGGLGGPGYYYVLSIEAEGNGGFASATPIDPPVIPSIDALIWPAGDLDFYAFTGQAGQVVTLDLASAVFNPVNPAIKGVLTLYDSSETPLATDSYTSADPNDPLIQALLPSSGTYYVEVREVRSYVGSPVAFYQLDVHLGPSAQNDTPATAIPLAVPRGVSGTVCPAGDQDDYSFVLAPPGTFSLDADARVDLLSLLHGTASVLSAGGTLLGSDSSVPDPHLTVSLGSGSYVASLAGGSDGLCQDAYYQLWIDGDPDGDGLRLPGDNCPAVYNPLQQDGDHDGVGDACDVCIAVFNPGQEGNLQAPEAVGETLALSTDPSGTLMQWTPAPGSVASNVYRALSQAGAPPAFACLGDIVTGSGFLDGDIPPAGKAFLYLITAENCGESGAGLDSGGQPRVLSACPGSL